MRFVIFRKFKDEKSGLEADSLETVDVQCPELEKALTCATTPTEKCYDFRKLIGATIVPDPKGKT